MKLQAAKTATAPRSIQGGPQSSAPAGPRASKAVRVWEFASPGPSEAAQQQILDVKLPGGPARIALALQWQNEAGEILYCNRAGMDASNNIRARVIPYRRKSDGTGIVCGQPISGDADDPDEYFNYSLEVETDADGLLVYLQTVGYITGSATNVTKTLGAPGGPYAWFVDALLDCWPPTGDDRWLAGQDPTRVAIQTLMPVAGA